MKWWPRLRAAKEDSQDELHAAFPKFEKIGETLTPNLRALRLAMTASDILLTMGVSANSVVSKALDITETYCKRAVHIDINSNLIMVSQLRGIENEPLTLIRPVTPRDTNNMTIQSVQRLIFLIRSGKYDLEQAEAALEAILKKPRAYPWWMIMLGNAGIVAGVALMFTSSWKMILTTFVIGILVDRLLAFMIKRSIPTFFRQVGAAMTVTLAAALVALLARNGVDFFIGMNPTLIVVGGIIMLLSGLVIVGAMQDAIEEYYLTAAARILKVGMLTVGIVIGILIGLYVARKLGFGIAVSADPLSVNVLHMRVIGAGVLAAAYALATHTHYRAIIWAGLIGASAITLAHTAQQFDIAVVPASGIAAIAIGLLAGLLSRLWNTPSAGIIAAGIVPLVPGLALYTSLMQLITYPPLDPFFFRGVGTLFTALATALAIAAGAAFGSMVGRPLHQKIAHSRNIAPFINYVARQFRPSSRFK